jgi:benzoyl-CoA 2,3-dioxygenase component B
MLTEEAHHMFVGETGIRRVVQRTVELMQQHPGKDVRELGGIDLDTLQRYINLWYSISLDLFGGEISSNAADFFGAGLKGRAFEKRYDDHLALEGSYTVPVPREGGQVVDEDVPLRNAMNEVLRDAYVGDNQRGVDMWNKTLAEAGIGVTLTLPSRRFHRNIGIYAGHHYTPAGEPISAEEFARRRDQWLPSAADRAYVGSRMQAVYEPGKIANWIAPPPKGINGRPVEFEYVRLD